MSNAKSKKTGLPRRIESLASSEAGASSGSTAGTDGFSFTTLERIGSIDATSTASLEDTSIQTAAEGISHPDPPANWATFTDSIIRGRRIPGWSIVRFFIIALLIVAVVVFLQDNYKGTLQDSAGRLCLLTKMLYLTVAVVITAVLTCLVNMLLPRDQAT